MQFVPMSFLKKLHYLHCFDIVIFKFDIKFFQEQSQAGKTAIIIVFNFLKKRQHQNEVQTWPLVTWTHWHYNLLQCILVHYNFFFLFFPLSFVSCNLHKYCVPFAFNWIWNSIHLNMNPMESFELNSIKLEFDSNGLEFYSKISIEFNVFEFHLGFWKPILIGGCAICLVEFLSNSHYFRALLVRLKKRE